MSYTTHKTSYCISKFWLKLQYQRISVIWESFLLTFLHYILLKGFSKWSAASPKCWFTTGKKKKKKWQQRQTKWIFPVPDASVYLCFHALFFLPPFQQQCWKKVLEQKSSNYFNVLRSASHISKRKHFRPFLRVDSGCFFCLHLSLKDNSLVYCFA